MLKLINRISSSTANQLGFQLTRFSTVPASSFLEYDKDPANKFLDPINQKLLKSVTRTQLAKVFRKRSVPKITVKTEFMTTEQIDAEIQNAIQRANALLQMPPIVAIQQETHKIISNDAALKSFSDSKYIFTDITYGLKDNTRRIVIRHPDGILENATADVRKRINSIYFPLEGRRHRMPRVFEPEYLKDCLDRREYEFILDRACIQFEPYEKEFHEITQKTYLHINETKEFDRIRSTRHFGPMTFFYAWHRMIDMLLIDMIERDYIQNGVQLIYLFYRLNDIGFDEKLLNTILKPSKSESILQTQMELFGADVKQTIDNTVGKTKEQIQLDLMFLEHIEQYVQQHSLRKSALELVLQKYRQWIEGQLHLLEGLEKAHGLS